MKEEKEICKDCPQRYKCVELIYAKFCPKGLHNVPLEEARNIQAAWKGDMELCPTCKGKKYIRIAN